MAGGERGLQRVRSVGAAQGLGALQRGETPPDQELVPAGAVLLGQRHRRAVRRGAGGQTRGLDLHQREQTEHLRLVGRQAGEDAAQALSLGAQAGRIRSSPAVAA